VSLEGFNQDGNAIVPAGAPNVAGGDISPGFAGMADGRDLEALADMAADVSGMAAPVAPGSFTELLQSIEDGSARVLTGRSGDYRHFSETLRKSAALTLAGGVLRLHILKGQRRTYAVHALIDLLRSDRPDVDIEHAINYVDATKLAQIYAASTAQDADDEADAEELEEWERRAIDLLRLADAEGATDIHIKIAGRRFQMRLRIDGNLYPLDSPAYSPEEGRRLLRALFAMAEAADPTYRQTESQDARIGGDVRADLPGGLDSIRLKFIPLSNNGRYAALRLQRLPPRVYDLSNQEDVDALGFDDDQVDSIKRMRARTNGIILFAGPTGSGKSRTLQCTLSAIDREAEGRKSIHTVEDPVELPIPAAAQRPVLAGNTAEERKEAYQIAINDLLRLDPDVIMLGEIRDAESGRAAFTLAMTGHLLLSTVHAVSALRIVSRLKNEGVDPFLLADPNNIVGLVSQRLVPKLCPNCSKPFLAELDARAGAAWTNADYRKRLTSLGNRLTAAGVTHETVKLRGSGCNFESGGRRCKGGYLGRTVVAETIEPDGILLELVSRGMVREADRYWYEHLGGKATVERALVRITRGDLDPRDVEHLIGPIEIPRERASIEKAPWDVAKYEARLYPAAVLS